METVTPVRSNMVLVRAYERMGTRPKLQFSISGVLVGQVVLPPTETLVRHSKKVAVNLVPWILTQVRVRGSVERFPYPYQSSRATALLWPSHGSDKSKDNATSKESSSNVVTLGQFEPDNHGGSQSSYLQTKPSKESSGYRILQRGWEQPTVCHHVRATWRRGQEQEHR